MTSKRSYHSDNITPAGADNLRSIKGIGPAVESCLSDAGIHTFAQLAAMSPSEIAAVVASVAGLSAKRIVEQDWIGQARERAAAPVATVQAEEIGAPTGGQRHEIFTVDLVLNDDNDVHHTRVGHVRGGEKETWAGWQADRLARFIVDQAALRLAPAEPALALAATDEPTPAFYAPPARTSVLRLGELVILAADTQERRGSFAYGEPFDIRLVLDLTEVAMPSAAPLDYAAAIYAKKLDGGPRQVVSNASGAIIPADQAALQMSGTTLARGVYRLETTVSLALAPEESGVRPEVMAWLESGLLQIY